VLPQKIDFFSLPENDVSGVVTVDAKDDKPVEKLPKVRVRTARVYVYARSVQPADARAGLLHARCTIAAVGVLCMPYRPMLCPLDWSTRWHWLIAASCMLGAPTRMVSWARECTTTASTLSQSPWVKVFALYNQRRHRMRALALTSPH